MYPIDYPSSSTEREKFLERFKPKRAWMEKWKKENAGRVVKIFKQLAIDFFPKVLIPIIVGYVVG